MIEVVLFGTGNVSSHLFKVIQQSDNVKIKQIYNHSEKSLEPFKAFVPTTTSLAEIAEADVFLLAVKDDTIQELAERLKNRNALVVHTSGSVSLEALNNITRAGVLYPLQTFSKGRELSNKRIPFCIEASNEKDLMLLESIVSSLSSPSYRINSFQRKKIHLAAVFVCNFVNYLYSIGEELCEENEIPFEILFPLIDETAQKIKNNAPKEVQTGPAIRNDLATINQQLSQLRSSDHREIYALLTKAIQKLHGKKF